MLSYQHLYHAGNRADVHKHAILAYALDYLCQKPKPLSYIETHSGRGLYDLGAAEALKTGEAAAGIAQLEQRFDKAHPYRRALDLTRAAHGPRAYPGSPMVALSLLRESDRLSLAELHPQEFAALDGVMPPRVRLERKDGFDFAWSITPPKPRRGLLLCDPSFEVKQDYQDIPDFFHGLARKWNVGILMLWYPILPGEPHLPMTKALREDFPDSLLSETRFAQLTPGKGIMGSGMFVVNPPWGLEDEARRIEALVAAP